MSVPADMAPPAMSEHPQGGGPGLARPGGHPGADSELATRLLPHRPPFLFIDRAQFADDGLAVTAERRFDLAEPYFAGHFPGDPIVPGVILVEMMAQAANLLLSRSVGQRALAYLVGVEEARFNRTVRPGETVRAEVRFADAPAAGEAPRAGSVVAFRAGATVDGQRCMRALVRIYFAGAQAPAPTPSTHRNPHEQDLVAR